MNETNHSHDQLLDLLRTLPGYDLDAQVSQRVQARAHVVLSRHGRRSSSLSLGLFVLGRIVEPVLATSLSACFLLWLVARCLQVYGWLSG
jgi:hypothetical protein